MLRNTNIVNSRTSGYRIAFSLRIRNSSKPTQVFDIVSIGHFYGHRIAVHYSGCERNDSCTVFFGGPPKQVILTSSDVAYGCVLAYRDNGLNIVWSYQSYGYHVTSPVLPVATHPAIRQSRARIEMSAYLAYKQMIGRRLPTSSHVDIKGQQHEP